jgi:hypothetical protein
MSDRPLAQRLVRWWLDRSLNAKHPLVGWLACWWRGKHKYVPACETRQWIQWRRRSRNVSSQESRYWCKCCGAATPWMKGHGLRTFLKKNPPKWGN